MHECECKCGCVRVGVSVGGWWLGGVGECMGGWVGG